jgi:hypothetical protein
MHDFNELSEAEKKHFYECKQCGEIVDMRQLDDVIFHKITSPGQTFSTAARSTLRNRRTSKALTEPA